MVEKKKTVEKKKHSEKTLEEIYRLYLKVKKSLMKIDDEVKRLGEMQMEIPDDYVTQAGLRKAHSVLKEVQSLKNEIVQKMLKCNSNVKKSEYLLNIGVDYVHETHPEIVALKNQESRERRAINSHSGLKEIYQFNYFHKLLYKDMELVLDNLKSANDNIKKQIEVIGHQIAIGEIHQKKPYIRKGDVGGPDL